MITISLCMIVKNEERILDRCLSTVADLVVTGCGMGIKNLHRYQNQYRAADSGAKNASECEKRREDGAPFWLCFLIYFSTSRQK